MAPSAADSFRRVHFRRYMRAQWRAKEFDLKKHDRVGVSIEQLVAHSRKRNAKVSTPYLDLWIAILDEFISWQLSLLTVFYSLRRNRRSWSDFDRAVTVVLMKVISDSIAMRLLIIASYDAAAKSLLRSIGEYTELFVALLDDPKLAKEFVKSDTPKGAKRFWNKHIARGSLQRKIQASWARWFQDKEPEAASWFANWGRQSNIKLSAFIHPSFAGGMFSALPFKTAHTTENWLGIWGDKSEGAVDTIYTYASFMFPMVLLHHDFPFDNASAGWPIIRFKKGNEIHKHVREGRSVLASLILSLGTKSNERYIFPEYDLSIFRARKRKSLRRRRSTDARVSAPQT